MENTGSLSFILCVFVWKIPVEFSGTSHSASNDTCASLVAIRPAKWDGGSKVPLCDFFGVSLSRLFFVLDCVCVVYFDCVRVMAVLCVEC